MKRFILSLFVITGSCMSANAQNRSTPTDTIQTVLENEKIKVVEYISGPGKDACGKGEHSHLPHLTIFFTDATIRLTRDGKTQDFDIKAGFSLWSEAETHIAINNGSNVAKVYLIQVK